MGLKILIIPGLTLTEIPEQSVETIKTIAGADSEVVICQHADADSKGHHRRDAVKAAAVRDCGVDDKFEPGIGLVD